MGYVYNSEGAHTAQIVIDDSRTASATPTGILDARGEMLMRVTQPIKQPLGFHTHARQAADTTSALVPASKVIIR